MPVGNTEKKEVERRRELRGLFDHGEKKIPWKFKRKYSKTMVSAKQEPSVKNIAFLKTL